MVSSIDFKNVGSNEGKLDTDDEIVITFNKELNPTSVHSSLTKGGTISVPLNGLFFRVSSDGVDSEDSMILVGHDISSYHIGNFAVSSNQVISGIGADVLVKSVSLDSTGEVITLSLETTHPTLLNEFADASDTTFIEFTASSFIKDIDGTSIDTSVKVKEANGNKHF